MRTDILMVLDKSGSMLGLTDDVLGGFNAFIAEQKKVPGEAYVSVWLFDSARHPALFRRVPLADVRTLTREDYTAGGNTALYDAVAESIGEAGRWFAELPEDQRPEQVVMVIQTDGHENASRHFAAADVRERIEHQKSAWNWQFVFLGADQDAWDVGSALGTQSVSYDNNSAGTRSAFAFTSDNVAHYRKVGEMSVGDADLRSSKT